MDQGSGVSFIEVLALAPDEEAHHYLRWMDGLFPVLHLGAHSSHAAINRPYGCDSCRRRPCMSLLPSQVRCDR